MFDLRSRAAAVTCGSLDLRATGYVLGGAYRSSIIVTGDSRSPSSPEALSPRQNSASTYQMLQIYLMRYVQLFDRGFNLIKYERDQICK
jgi:hypothetical protein